MSTLGLLYLAIGPGIAIAVYIYYSDKWQPEPKRLVALSFILGALACFPTGYFEQAFRSVFGLEGIVTEHYRFFWWQKAFYAFFGVALAEELCKFLFLKAFIYDRLEFNEPFDGIVYGGMIGCGFATLENIIYVLEGGYQVGILRMLTAVPGHAFEGIILGYFMGKAKFCPGPAMNLAKGLVLVTILHGVYDTAAFSHETWSFFLIFGIVFLGIYLGLKAKRELEKHSDIVEHSTKKYFLVENGEVKRSLELKDIRDSLTDGRLKPDDILVSGEDAHQKPAKEFLCSDIDFGYKGLPKTPAEGQPTKLFLIFYGCTFGLYLYFWFLRNYRDFRNYKNIDLNPELRALGFFVLTLVPFFIYGVILATLEKDVFGPAVEISFNLLMAGTKTAFLFFQLQMIKGFLKERLEKSFPLPGIILMIFILSGLNNLLPATTPHYWLLMVAFALAQGGILAVVQKNLNLYWQLEKEKLDEEFILSQ